MYGEAIDLYIEALEEDQLPVPVETFDAILVAVWASCPNSPVRNASPFCTGLASVSYAS
jgi:hypothetical protein